MTAPQVKPRYFYPASRAHHAYCMAIDFGMKLCNSRGETLLLEAVKRDSQYERFYVHPGSVSLLEPVDGDVIHRTNGYHQTVGFNIGVAKAAIQIDAGGIIVQRSAQPFMWPEQEAA